MRLRRELFRETEGNQEDELIPKDATTIHLKEDEHFYSQVGFEIVVNARPHVVSDKRVGFEDPVQFAFQGVHGENIVFSVRLLNDDSGHFTAFSGLRIWLR